MGNVEVLHYSDDWLIYVVHSTNSDRPMNPRMNQIFTMIPCGSSGIVKILEIDIDSTPFECWMNHTEELLWPGLYFVELSWDSIYVITNGKCVSNKIKTLL